MVDWAEFRAGLAETRRYLLSHHEPADHHRCYAPIVLGRSVHLCARCSGVYPGIAVGLLAALAGPPAGSSPALVAVLPLPALVDWAATAFTRRGGANPVRTATGAALGYAYSVGLVLLFLGGDIRVLAVGAAYALAAVGLIALARPGHSTDQAAPAAPSTGDE